MCSIAAVVFIARLYQASTQRTFSLPLLLCVYTQSRQLTYRREKIMRPSTWHDGFQVDRGTDGTPSLLYWGRR